MQKASSINLDLTINSGQVFLWDKVDDTWFGIDGQDLLVIKDEPVEIISSSKKIYNFFRESDNLGNILLDISKDSLVKSAVKHFSGLRLMRQDPFQCYISFICSSNSSIQNIRSTLKNLCKKFGNEIDFEKKKFYTFPPAKRLSNASNRDLLSCGLGFRTKYVKQASKMVEDGKIDFRSLRKEDYKSALENLKKIHGIGNKVADCILLFSLDKLEAFPLDRWTQRILQKYYFKIFHDMQGKSMTENRYSELHEKIVEYFGPYAGYSQQFLFKMERDLYKKNWL
jgi:N-glycosylase/DNA lyase